MIIIDNPAALKSEYLTGALTEEEYVDQIIWQIGHTHDVRTFLQYVYRNFYDPNLLVSPVSTFTDKQLETAFEQIEADCANRNDYVIAEYVGLLKDLLTNPQAGLMVRWALAKLVGMALVREN